MVHPLGPVARHVPDDGHELPDRPAGGRLVRPTQGECTHAAGTRVRRVFRTHGTGYALLAGPDDASVVTLAAACIEAWDVRLGTRATQTYTPSQSGYFRGVLSPDGHAWATQGVAVDYLEKTFGAWVRSYPFAGDDPLGFAPTGCIWDNASPTPATTYSSSTVPAEAPIDPFDWRAT